MIRLALPEIDERDIAAVVEALRSGYLVQGARVRAFEERVARTVGTSHAVAVSNCTAALQLALLALEIAPNDRVAVTTYSWPATANVITLCGAQPVFVDIDARTFNMDPGRLEQVLANDRRIRAVLPVHAFGGMADMPRIMEVAASYDVPVIEDAACALGARLRQRSAGQWGRVGCFSFHPRKAVTTGEGGIIATDDMTIANRTRALRNHGQDPCATAPDFVMPGYNLRMTEFQAALGSTQMDKLDSIIAARRERAARYDALLADSPITVPNASEPDAHVFQSYVVLVPPNSAARRDAIIAEMRAERVEVTIGTHHMPLTRYFRTTYGYKPGDFPVTDDVAARAITLPLHTRLTSAEQEQVVRKLVARL
ncbi:MAG TPA: DegT/DnrJ/EryC1/StrS family aminotransferase [Gemmatimonadaceae bacterium]|nr:DegT/DnrJ/EryC1/StrS family aminotransferase [Gemmatimonadaceae bacterium]